MPVCNVAISVQVSEGTCYLCPQSKKLRAIKRKSTDVH